MFLIHFYNHVCFAPRGMRNPGLSSGRAVSPYADTLTVPDASSPIFRSRSTGLSMFRRLRGGMRPGSRGRMSRQGARSTTLEQPLASTGVDTSDDVFSAYLLSRRLWLPTARRFGLTQELEEGNINSEICVQCALALMLISASLHIEHGMEQEDNGEEDRRAQRQRMRAMYRHCEGVNIHSRRVQVMFRYCYLYLKQGDNLQDCKGPVAQLYFSAFIRGQQESDRRRLGWEPASYAEKMDYNRIQYVIERAFSPDAVRPPSTLGKYYCYVLDFMEWIFRVVTFSGPAEFSNVRAHNLLSCLISIRDNALPEPGAEPAHNER